MPQKSNHPLLDIIGPEAVRRAEDRIRWNQLRAKAARRTWQEEWQRICTREPFNNRKPEQTLRP
jgi:hypothetical protein